MNNTEMQCTQCAKIPTTKNVVCEQCFNAALKNKPELLNELVQQAQENDMGYGSSEAVQLLKELSSMHEWSAPFTPCTCPAHEKVKKFLEREKK